ncbi:sodium:alanine symporter family protein [Fusobacterium sp.]|uniref:alanine/glycine:cation symporter family protein n=1 Tax=Fusobacterium sp. TaxID=68766 RepID=UPI0025B7B127|nr:alanine/glycine:cation symporter family protein [Fusobacterium sp.]
MNNIFYFLGELINLSSSYILIAMLIVIGVYFTIKTGFVQLRMLKEMFRLLGEGAIKGKDGHRGISSFQAFCISTASRVGTGNLAGVAIAISIGGPGSVFWMWIMAIIGASLSFVESTLAQIYKEKDGDHFRGGPAYYIEKALGLKWLGVLFSIIITIVFGLIFNSVQANTITLAFEKAFFIDKKTLGIILSVLTGIIIFGGVRRIAKVVEYIVPIMAVAYVSIAVFVIVKNIGMVPEIFLQIVKGAFGVNQAVAGGIGTIVMQGVKRGLFSNEAGMGSAPNAAAAANVSHPAKQGLIQTLGVFTDTLLICSATAFIILISGENTKGVSDGIQLTQEALVSQIGSWGSIFIAICILMFAFSSIIGNYYYGEANIEFLNGKKLWLILYRVSVIGMVMFGSIAKIQVVWNLADFFMGIMAIINLIAISLIGNIAIKALKDYREQKARGLDPKFKKSSIPELENIDCWEE